MRHRGSRSAIQATLAGANVPQEHAYEIESVDTFDNVRVLNNPGSESYGITSSDDSKSGAVLYELRSEEFAILSTESSSSSEPNHATPDNLAVQSIPSSNSQRIDEWCLNNELSRLPDEQQPALTSLRVQDIIHSWAVDQSSINDFRRKSRSKFQIKGDPQENFTLKMLEGLSEEQLFKVKQLTKELLPLLRNCRRYHPAYTHRFRSIPSVFPQRDLVLSCSLQYTEPEWSSTKFLDKFSSVYLEDVASNSTSDHRSWLGWTLVPRLTDSELS